MAAGHVFANQYDDTVSIYQNEVPFGGPPVITTQPGDQMCGEQHGNLQCDGWWRTALEYQWSFNRTNLVGATNALLTLNNVQFNQAGNYTVLVTNFFGLILSSNATLTVNLPPPVPVIFGLARLPEPLALALTISGTNFQSGGRK